MSYYDLTPEQQATMNVDYDFCAALEYNHQPFTLLDVERVLAVVEGERDERDWHWIARLRDGRYVYLTGGCDYTGWDCRSNADSVFATTLDAVLLLTPETDTDDSRPIRADLTRQIAEGKRQTEADRLNALAPDVPWLSPDLPPFTGTDRQD